jgi:hypothetical protein
MGSTPDAFLAHASLHCSASYPMGFSVALGAAAAPGVDVWRRRAAGAGDVGDVPRGIDVGVAARAGGVCS